MQRGTIEIVEETGPSLFVIGITRRVLALGKLHIGEKSGKLQM